MLKKILGKLGSKKEKKHQSRENTNEEKKKAEIDKYLETLNQQNKKTISLLMLGIGGCGKSTIIKQLKKIYTGSISIEAAQSTNNVKLNILEDIYDLCMQHMICFLFTKQCYLNIFIPIQIINIISHYYYGTSIVLNKESQIICKEIISLKNSNSKKYELTPDLATKISILWNDTGLQETFNIRKQQRVMHNTSYFIQNIHKISQPEYVADMNDYIRLSDPTTGIVEHEFYVSNDDNRMNKWKFKVTDVGGHRQERKKWLRCFCDIHSVIYVMPLDGYDTTIFEDNTQNCYREALDVFERTMNHHALETVDCIVFLNKNDLFVSKIKEIPFSVFEPNFDEELVYNANAVKDYLRSEYKKRFYNGIKADKSPRRIHFHLTCATDTNQIQTVMHLIQYETVRKPLTVGMLM